MEKNLDSYGRWRSAQIGFRLSPEERQLVDDLVAISGKSKQEYITDKLLNRDIIVEPNPRVYIKLKGLMNRILEELERLELCSDAPPELWILIEQINKTLYGFKGGEDNEQ